ncbi:putative exonuclease [Golovinomyces cichoracearum]|uniref:Putative exonuclease n=1 Tax=Golovinomyces cichoracearum TaxID=62708 RepID=A0A420J1S7_9PEZI|nr:putative exonuclease [Golovinomyces cichoracearum]
MDESIDDTSRSPSVSLTKKRKFESDHQSSPRKLNNINSSSDQDDRDTATEKIHSISDKESSTDVDHLKSSHQEKNKKRLKKIPKSDSDNYPSITFSNDCRLQSQIKISDLQSLILYILADGSSPKFVSVRNRPQIRKVVVLMIPGLELSMFKTSDAPEKEPAYSSPDFFYPKKLITDKLPDNIKLFAEMFEHVWPVKTPGDDKYMKMHSPFHAMLTAPIPKSIEEIRESKTKKGPKTAKEPHGWKNKPALITEFCHTPEELLENDYVLHPAMYDNDEEKEKLQEQRLMAKTSKEFGWVDTLVADFENSLLHGLSKLSESTIIDWEVLAMDCEMCLTGESESSLTRISIVAWDNSVVLDELVKPENPITNYLTQYSGITKKMLENVTTTLIDIQEKLVKLLHPRTILIGHSLNSDLTALKITHPFIIDTALLYPHPRGPPLKSSLKLLAQRYLGREIQKGHGSTGPGAGHDSIEDAKTCLDLVKQKCEKGKDWGTYGSYGENIFKRVARTGVQYKCQEIPGSLPKTGKSSAAVDWGNPGKGPGAAANFSISCKSDEEVMEGVIRAIHGDIDGKEIPGGGVDFIWGRLRELEATKGWWNKNQQNSSHISQTMDNSPGGVHVKIGIEATSIKSSSESAIPLSSTSHDCPKIMSKVTADLTNRIYKIYSSLPPCTAFVIYSGSGSPIEMSRLQSMQSTFKREYKIKKWDQLSVKWTDVEEQALRKAHLRARNGVGFLGIK